MRSPNAWEHTCREEGNAPDAAGTSDRTGGRPVALGYVRVGPGEGSASVVAGVVAASACQDEAGMVSVPAREVRQVPFAAGVIVVGGTAEARSTRADRLAVALAAWRAGYFLVDTIEVDATEPVTGPGWGQVWELVSATEADRLFTYGVDEGALEPMAGELRLLVRRVDAAAEPPRMTE